MTLDNSGRLNIAKTGSAFGTVGHELDALGQISSTADGRTAVYLNRLSSDGKIQQFHKDGTEVGAIGNNVNNLTINGSNAVELKQGGTTRAYIYSSGFHPWSDATYSLGASSSRWSDIYLSGGVYLGGTASNHKLDHYEYGGWTPTISAGSGNESINVQRARYTRIGNLVTITASIAASGQNFQGTGGVAIGNLPFASSGTGQEAHGAVMVNLVDFPTGYTQIVAYKYSGHQYVGFYFSGDTVGWAQLLGGHVTQNDTIQFTVTYAIVN